MTRATRVAGSLGLLSSIFVMADTAAALAYERIFNFHVLNVYDQPMTVELTGGNCYEGNPPSGEVFENIAPGEHVTIVLARVQGHGCDGEGGEFSLKFDPPIGRRAVQNFMFDNGGILWLATGANAYPGKLSAKQADESYTYFTAEKAKVNVTASKPEGSWELICQQICNKSRTKTTTEESSTEKSRTSEETSAISVALEAGVDLGAFSATTTVTGSLEKKIGASMSESFLRGETNTDTSNYVFTLEEMKQNNIFAVWQYVARTTLSTGKTVLVRSDRFTCTSDAAPPQYLPGSPEDLAACRGGLAPQPARAQPAGQTTATAQITGLNVTEVDIADGAFINLRAKQWQARGNDGTRSALEEQERTVDYVTLFDPPRNLHYSLDLTQNIVWYSENGGDWQQFSPITGSRAGRN